MQTEEDPVEQAKNYIVQLMLDSKVRLGDRLVESRLAKQLKLNRSIIREALNRLQANRLVDYKPNCGYRCRTFGIQDVVEVWELREAIEPVAARGLASQRTPAVLATLEQSLAEYRVAVAGGDAKAGWQADKKFHFSIVEGSGNRRFAEIYGRFSIEVVFMPWPFGHDTHEPSGEGIRATIEMHEEIFDLIVRGKTLKAQSLVAEHVFYAKESFFRHLLPSLAKQGDFISGVSQMHAAVRK